MLNANVYGSEENQWIRIQSNIICKNEKSALSWDEARDSRVKLDKGKGEGVYTLKKNTFLCTYYGVNARGGLLTQKVYAPARTALPNPYPH